jgi:lactate dehydrogenase-like 2-hydroxyacid dehydrogenase
MPNTDVLMPEPMLPLVIEQLDARFVLHRLWEAPDPGAFFKEFGPRIRGIATSTSHGRTNTELLEHMPNVEIISSFGVGYDNVDTAEAARRRIVVTNTPDVLNDEVADLTIGLLIATIRQLPQADRYLREGKWLEGPFPLTATLRERKVGIVGLGASARRSRVGSRGSASRYSITAAHSRRASPTGTSRLFSASPKRRTS